MKLLFTKYFYMFNKKVLTLGTNSQITDTQTTELAKARVTVNHGLIPVPDFNPPTPGFYHTSVVDFSSGDVINLAKRFDEIIMLDQPYKEWSHWKILLSTYKVAVELDRLGYNITYKDNDNIKALSYFSNLLSTNKSFCIYPWIHLQNDRGPVTVCVRSTAPVTTLDAIEDWQTDPNFEVVRNKMLAGELLTGHCDICYQYESKNIESSRIYETLEWVTKLNLKDLDSLKDIKHPYFYEVRLDNICNLQCRSCKPEHSVLIEKEYKKINMVYTWPQAWAYSGADHIDIDSIKPETRIYFAGGEPTASPKFYEFMETCIAKGKTDFELTLSTNGTKINQRLLNLTKHFTNMNFSISVDSYGKVNDYYRWNSNFDSIIKNGHDLEQQGHSITFLCVPNIYTVTNLHLLFQCLDQEFPHSGVYMQYITYPDEIQSAFNNPNPQAVIDSMKKCQQTKMYHSGHKSCKTIIDSLLAHYSDPGYRCDLDTLKKFFEFSDKLDQSRGVKLVDYVPELEACRHLINK